MPTLSECHRCLSGGCLAAGPRQPGADTVYEVIMGNAEAAQAISNGNFGRQFCLFRGRRWISYPAHLELAAAELELVPPSSASANCARSWSRYGSLPVRHH